MYKHLVVLDKREVFHMSKKKRNIEKEKKRRARQVKQQAKAKRLSNGLTWEEKKACKRQVQQEKWESFPNANEDCKLPLSKTPSPINCIRCELDCLYNHNG